MAPQMKSSFCVYRNERKFKSFGVTESPRVEKTSKIIQSRHPPTTSTSPITTSVQHQNISVFRIFPTMRLKLFHKVLSYSLGVQCVLILNVSHIKNYWVLMSDFMFLIIQR